MKGIYSVYVIFPKTIKPPEHLETNLAPSPPPKNIDHADKKLIPLGIYATSMCNPLKKTSSPRKNVNVFFFNHIPLPTPRKYFNRHCKISITRTNPPHSKNLNSLEYVNSYS